MNANEREWFDGTVRCVVGAAFEVSNCLGSGFLEKVYERALMIELQDRGLKAASQVKLPVKYKGKPVGNYVADLLVQDRILIELKCTESLAGTHMAQCINYLKASNLKVCLLLNFQKPKLEWKKIVHNI